MFSRIKLPTKLPIKLPTMSTSKGIIAIAVLAAGTWALVASKPLHHIGNGEVGVRINQFSGDLTQVRNGMVLVLPGLHQLRRYPMQDQIWRPKQGGHGNAPFQSIEGLSLGVDLSVRYALDPAKVGQIAKNLAPDLNGQVVEPAVQGIIYKAFARYTVREIFSTKRQELQQLIEAELKPQLAADGILLRGVMIGKVELPADYRAGMEKLLATELESEKMRFTLELKEKLVKQTALEADAEKIRREKAAEASASEQIIAAKAQEEAMKHVLPFKQKQIEQRGLEADAEKGARIKQAEGNAQARRIEAAGEADSRQKLADAEVYRLEAVNKVTSVQMEREGVLISKHPLLIQKTMADKLSDKIQVIIAPPPADGGFIGASLLGAGKRHHAAVEAVPAHLPASDETTGTQE